MKKALIVGGGPIDLEQLQIEVVDKPEVIIAADRGGEYLRKIGAYPTILVGDFDSLSLNILGRMSANGVRVIPYPQQKNKSDLELAVEIAINQQMEQIKILGGLGGRFDHTMGNIGLLLNALEHGVSAHLLDSKHNIFTINQKTVVYNKPEWNISLMPLTPKVTGVTTSGFEYDLNNEELDFKSSRGIHNGLLGDTATIDLADGVLLVIYFKE